MLMSENLYKSIQQKTW